MGGKELSKIISSVCGTMCVKYEHLWGNEYRVASWFVKCLFLLLYKYDFCKLSIREERKRKLLKKIF